MSALDTTTKRHKTLIFHIGDHKTGSTSIQLAFTQNQVSLTGRSLFYPAMLASNVLGDHCTAYSKPNSSEARDAAVSAFRKLAKRVRDSNAEFCLISAEALEGVPAQVFYDVVSEFFAHAADEIRIIAYVRPHAARITSSYAERLKTGMPQVIKEGLERFHKRTLRKGEFIYEPRFSAWKDAFGDRFILRPMIRNSLYKQSVVDDFACHAFQTRDFKILELDQANESLSLEDLMLLKVLHSQLDKGATRSLRRTLGWEFARIAGLLPPPETQTKLRLHKSLAQEIRSAYLDDARAMDQAFFGGQALLEAELDRSVETALPVPLSTDPDAYFQPSELRAITILSHILVGALENDEVNWSDFLHQKRISEVRRNRARIATQQNVS